MQYKNLHHGWSDWTKECRFHFLKRGGGNTESYWTTFPHILHEYAPSPRPPYYWRIPKLFPLASNWWWCCASKGLSTVITRSKSFPSVSCLFIQSSMRMIWTRSVGSLTIGIKIDCAWRCSRNKPVGRKAMTRVHSNPGSSTDHFDWEGPKIQGNRKKAPRKCPFLGKNLKFTTPEEGRGKEKVETCSVTVPSEVGF